MSRARRRLSRRWQRRIATVVVGAAIVAGWVAAGRIENRISGDGERSPAVTAQRVQPFDPDQPSAEFYRENVTPFRSAAARRPSVTLLEWSFALDPVPARWKRLGLARARAGEGVAELRTSDAPYEVQLESPPALLPAGAYDVVLDGEISRGGVQLLVLGKDGDEVARGLYWSGVSPRPGESMVVTFELEAPADISFALANWSVDGGAASWRLRTLTLRGRIAEARFAPPKEHSLSVSLVDVVEDVRPRLAELDTVWERASAVRDAVRAALPQSESPSNTAAAMWVVGSELGIPVRLVRTSANELNEFDSYATTEVWLEDERRWAIVDAYFGGYWTRGRAGPPVGVAELSRLVRAGRAGSVFWHAAPAPRALLPSRHYVDPRQLHAHYAIALTSGERQLYVAPADASPAGIRRYRMIGSLDFGRTDPDRALRVAPTAVLQRRRDARRPPSPRPTDPLRYADAILLERVVRPKVVRGRGRVTIVLDASTYGFVTVTPVQRATLNTGGAQYALTEVRDGRSISPIVLLNPMMSLAWRQLESRELTIRAWSVERFPEDHEIRSVVPPADD